MKKSGYRWAVVFLAQVFICGNVFSEDFMMTKSPQAQPEKSAQASGPETSSVSAPSPFPESSPMPSFEELDKPLSAPTVEEASGDHMPSGIEPSPLPESSPKPVEDLDKPSTDPSPAPPAQTEPETQVTLNADGKVIKEVTVRYFNSDPSKIESRGTLEYDDAGLLKREFLEQFHVNGSLYRSQEVLFDGISELGFPIQTFFQIKEYNDKGQLNGEQVVKNYKKIEGEWKEINNQIDVYHGGHLWKSTTYEISYYSSGEMKETTSVVRWYDFVSGATTGVEVTNENYIRDPNMVHKRVVLINGEYQPSLSWTMPEEELLQILEANNGGKT